MQYTELTEISFQKPSKRNFTDCDVSLPRRGNQVHPVVVFRLGIPDHETVHSVKLRFKVQAVLVLVWFSLKQGSATNHVQHKIAKI